MAYEFAVKKNARGIPTMDWARFRSRSQRITNRSERGIILENRFLRVTVIPGMGRIHSMVHKPSGKEQLWVNPAAIPIPAHNDTGYWVTWGGMESVLPRGEHGTSHALSWQWSAQYDPGGSRSVQVWSSEPLTGLRHRLTYRLRANSPALETSVTVTNPGPGEVRYSHWTTALLAPGGRGEITPKMEIIVPASRFVAADRPFNRWMAPMIDHPERSPLRFVGNWRDIGDLMATPLLKPYFGVYSHEEDVGVIRVIDRRKTPGINVWTWGFPPSKARQREYTAAPPNRGYVELWNGTSTGFDDGSLRPLKRGEVVGWTEYTYLLDRLANVSGPRTATDKRLGHLP